jgi:hypothetical protein
MKTIIIKEGQRSINVTPTRDTKQGTLLLKRALSFPVSDS